MAAGDDAAAVELDAADAARVAFEGPHVALTRQPAPTQLVPLPVHGENVSRSLKRGRSSPWQTKYNS